MPAFAIIVAATLLLPGLVSAASRLGTVLSPAASVPGSPTGLGTRWVVTATTFSPGRPDQSAFSPNGTYIFVPGWDTCTLSAIDAASASVVTTINIDNADPGSCAYSPVVTPNGTYVYITNPATSNISVIDTQTWDIVTRIDSWANGGAWTNSMSPQGVLWTVCSKGNYSAVCGYSTVTNSLIYRYAGPVLKNSSTSWDKPRVSPYGQYVWVSPNFGSSAYRVTVSTGQVATYPGRGVGFSDVAVDPNGSWVLYADWSGDQLVILNATTGANVTRVALNEPANEIGISPGGEYAYVSSATGYLFVVDLITLRLVYTVDLTYAATGPAGVSVSPSGDEVFVSDNSGPFIRGRQVSGTVIRPSGVVTVDSLSLQWENPAGALTGESVYWGDPSCSSMTQIVIGAQTGNYTLTGLSPGTEYGIEVAARNSTGPGPLSSCTDVWTLALGSVSSLISRVAPYLGISAALLLVGAVVAVRRPRRHTHRRGR